MNNSETILRKRAQAILYQLDKCKCDECPLEEQCRLNESVYEESICEVLRNGQAQEGQA